MAADSDDQPTAADSPRTVAAEHYSEPPTTVVPDVGLTQTPELAWSPDADDDETIAFDGRSWLATWGRVAVIAASAVLGAAVEERRIPHNPCEGVRLPNGSTPTVAI